jgi:hypothetical protein
MPHPDGVLHGLEMECVVEGVVVEERPELSRAVSLR